MNKNTFTLVLGKVGQFNNGYGTFNQSWNRMVSLRLECHYPNKSELCRPEKQSGSYKIVSFLYKNDKNRAVRSLTVFADYDRPFSHVTTEYVVT